jgi:hypothetical protein
MAGNAARNGRHRFRTSAGFRLELPVGRTESAIAPKTARILDHSLTLRTRHCRVPKVPAVLVTKALIVDVLRGRLLHLLQNHDAKVSMLILRNEHNGLPIYRILLFVAA